MSGVARLGDLLSHVQGAIVSASEKVSCDGIGVARHGDSTWDKVHHFRSIATASEKVFVDGLPVARVGDATTCTAVIVSGSAKTSAA